MLLRIPPLALLILILTIRTTALAQQVSMPLWTHGAPERVTVKGAERDATTAKDALVAGHRIIHLTDVSEPSLAVYKAVDARAVDARAGAAEKISPAVVVFPGGGYQILAYDLEGTEVCAWLNSIHMTCVLVKYRVPIAGRYPEHVEDLEDAQQAMRLTRAHAAEWGIDPKRVGVLGFSAGAHLAAVLSNHADFVGVGEKADGGVGTQVNARPDFALIIYPGYLATGPKLMDLAQGVEPSATTPTTFLLQAEDDPVHEENALVYFQALKAAKVPAELHIYAQGGHGYGLRPTELPITHWPALAETWFRTIHVLGER